MAFLTSFSRIDMPNTTVAASPNGGEDEGPLTLHLQSYDVRPRGKARRQVRNLPQPTNGIPWLLRPRVDTGRATLRALRMTGGNGSGIPRLPGSSRDALGARRGLTATSPTRRSARRTAILGTSGSASPNIARHVSTTEMVPGRMVSCRASN